MTAETDLAVRLVPDLDSWQRALIEAATITADFVNAVDQVRRTMGASEAEFTRLLRQAASIAGGSRRELAAQRRVDQAMRLRARRAARRARRATARAMRAAA